LALLAVAVGVAACQPQIDGDGDGEGGDPEPPLLTRPVEQAPSPAAPEPTSRPAPPPWTFVVMSDLHLPNYKAAVVQQTVAALIAMHPRAVVITGDHTNGSITDVASSPKTAYWWKTVLAALQPLRDAGIPVLPIAGNHDSYLDWQRRRYAGAFVDLDAWAAPLHITAQHTGSSVSRAPFSYSVDIDGVHLSLVHIVAQWLDHDVASWLAADLAAAADAKHRIVFGHVPLSSVIRPPNRAFVASLGTILEHGHAEMYVAGHEHVVWDDEVALPDGGKLRQLLVGCSSGFYDFAPSELSRNRARCVKVALSGQRDPMRCAMPNGGGEFVLARGRKNRELEHYTNSFTVFTVDGDTIEAQPMTIDDRGRPHPFYLDR
jgi:3',5'-cyclic AMP phosphodiesterase CpdA